MEHKLAAVNTAPSLVGLCNSIVDLLRTFRSSYSSEYTATSSTSPSTPSGESPSLKLSQEIRQLSTVLEQVRGGYGSDLYSKHSDIESRFWSDIGSAVRSCKSNLQSLEKSLSALAENSGGWKSMFKARKSTRFNQANSEFTVYRHLTPSYREVLALSLEVSNLAVQSGRVNRVEELKKRIAKLSIILKHRGISKSVKAEQDALNTMAVLQQCVTSAAALLSEAAYIWKMPVEIDGQVMLAELDSTEAKSWFETERGPADSPRERLSQPSFTETQAVEKGIDEPKVRADPGVKGASMDVTSGMREGIVHSPPPRPPPQELPEAPQPPQPPQPPIQVPDTQVHELHGRDEDSESDWEADLKKGMTSIAQEKYEQGDYAGAVDFLRKILESTNVDEKYFIMLAVCLIRLEKWDEAEQILLKLERSPSQESACRAQHHLAELYIGTSQLEKAKTYANKAKNGKKKLYGKNDARTLQSVYLYVTSLKLNKQDVEAASLSRLFPQDFQPEESEISKCFESVQNEQKVVAVESKKLPPPAPEVKAPDEIGDILVPLDQGDCDWLEEFGLKLSADGLAIEGTPKENRDGRTAAHRACELGKDQILRLLLKRGDINLNKRDRRKDTAILLAAHNEQVECVRALVDKGPFGGMRQGVVVDAKNSFNMCPILFAAQKRNGDMVKYLLNAGADIELPGQREGTPLHEAADNNRVNNINTLLDAGANINSRDKYGDPPLTWACIRSQVEALCVLIERGADVNIANKDGNTPLMRANRQLSEILLQKGADVNKTNRNGYSALYFEVEKGNKGKVELLLKHGADVNVVLATNSSTPLHAAAWHKNDAIAQLLLQRGADPNVKDHHGKIPLCFAAAPMAELLIVAGSEIETKDERNLRPLHWAVLDDRPGVVKLLIENHCEINPQGIDGMTPLAVSVQHQRSKCFQLLMDANADVNLANNRGRTPLHHVENNSKEMAAALLERGADVDHVDDNGSSALHHATRGDKPGVARVLVEHGARHSLDGAKYTPLHGCAMYDRDKVLKILLETQTEGFDLEAVNDGAGKTPLHFAAHHSAFKVVPLLLEAGARVDAQDSNGRTPLMYCSSENVAKHLLGPSISSKDSNGWTALHWACQHSRPRVAALLVESGIDQMILSADNGLPAIVLAARWNHVDVIKQMILKNATLDVKALDGRTALFEAVTRGHADLANTLTKAGANAGIAGPDGRPIFQIAEEKGVNLN